MIRKLRRQFILVAMSSTFAVLLVIIGALNILNYGTIVRQKDDILTILSANQGRFPTGFGPMRNPRNNGFSELQTEEKDLPWMKDGKAPRFREDFSREMPYETRFFTVTIENGEAVKKDLGMIASIEEDASEEYAKTVLAKYEKRGKDKGFYDEYRYMITKTEQGYSVVFVDCSSDLSGFRKELVTSIVVSALGFFAVFLLVLFFSKKVFRPVEESYQKQKHFITDASHELKTPLTIISANVEVMEMESEESNWSQSIKKQVSRMIGLVDQLVTLSRLDEQVESSKERFSLSDAILDTAQNYVAVAESGGKEFTIDVAENLSMSGDEKQIRQMTGLLLDNAMKYAAFDAKANAESGPGADQKEAGQISGKEAKKAAERPKIRISLQQKGKKAELRLWNTTDELAQGAHDELFERFYRPDSSRNSKTGGSGIGLSIVKSIAEAHHGKVTAVSKDGKSIEFKVSLPLG